MCDFIRMSTWTLTFHPRRCHQSGWVLKAPRAPCFHVHGSSRTLTAPIDLCNACARARTPLRPLLRDTDSHRAAGAEDGRLFWALQKPTVAGSGERCGRRAWGKPAAPFTSAASIASAAAPGCSFDGASPRTPPGLCEHHARPGMPAVGRSVHR